MYPNKCRKRAISRISLGIVRAACAVLLSAACVGSTLASENFNASIEKHYIIGGQPVERNDYPWLVALVRNANAELVQRQFCGGSIIADQWVLTAAHCLYDKDSAVVQLDSFKVATNAANLNDEGVPELDVANIFIHPSYEHSSPNPHSDIALIELANPSGIAPITLSTKASDKLFGLQATVIGWGAIDNTDPTRPQYPVWLHSVEVPIVPLSVCNSPQSYEGVLYPNQLCAGYAQGGHDSCVGDSGGPLIVTYEGVVQQAGVVSFGYGCALPNYYGIYTNIPYFIDWINQYVFVGDKEFEPELLDVKGSNSIQGGGGGTSSDTGGTSLFALIALFAGLIIRRRRLC